MKKAESTLKRFWCYFKSAFKEYLYSIVFSAIPIAAAATGLYFFDSNMPISKIFKAIIGKGELFIYASGMLGAIIYSTQMEKPVKFKDAFNLVCHLAIILSSIYIAIYQFKNLESDSIYQVSIYYTLGVLALLFLNLFMRHKAEIDDRHKLDTLNDKLQNPNAAPKELSERMLQVIGESNE